MNAIQDKAAFLLPDISTGDDRWSKLMALADMMEIDELTGALTITMENPRLRCARMAAFVSKGFRLPSRQSGLLLSTRPLAI
ncbi:hypothetical protein ACQZ44_18525 [Agrobacterium vitis]